MTWFGKADFAQTLGIGHQSQHADGVWLPDLAEGDEELLAAEILKLLEA